MKSGNAHQLKSPVYQLGQDRRSCSGEPTTPANEGLHKMTPIPKDTQQRLRSRSSVSPDTQQTPEQQILVGETGSYQKPERKR